MKNSIGRPKSIPQPRLAACKRLNPDGWDGLKKRRPKIKYERKTELPIGKDQKSWK